MRIDRDKQTVELFRRISLGWAKHSKLHDILKGDVPAFKIYVLAILTYDAMTKTTTSFRDKMQNDDIRIRTAIDDVLERITSRRIL